MNDFPELPSFLDLKLPENREARREARRHWRPSAVRAEAARARPMYRGHPLPETMADPAHEGWAFIRQQEQLEAAEAKARAAAKAAEATERRRVRKFLKATKPPKLAKAA